MININATIILTILNFILFVIILKAILFKPLTKFLDERTKKIDDSLRLAEENKKRSEEIQLEQDYVIKEAREKAAEIINIATKNASRESSDIISRANEEAQVNIKAAKAEIQKEVERARTSLQKEVMNLTISLSSKVLNREINEKDHKELIEKGFEELKKEKK